MDFKLWNGSLFYQNWKLPSKVMIIRTLILKFCLVRSYVSYYSLVQNKLDTFKIHISHKLDCIMNLFENIYKAWYLGMKWWKWHQNQCSNTEMGAIFGQTVKKFTIKNYDRLCCVHDDTTEQYNTSSKAHMSVKCFLIICQKVTPISLFQHQSLCHFHQILPRYHT